MKRKQNGHFNVLKSMLVKEFKQLFRDRRMWGLLFGSPMLMLLLFGYAVNTDVKKIKVAILDEDKSAQSRSFVERFTSTKYFIPFVYVNRAKDADSFLDTNKVDMFLHVERNFSKNLLANRQAQVQVAIDGSDSNRASVISTYINQVALRYSKEYSNNKLRMLIFNKNNGPLQVKKGILLKERIMFNPDLDSRNFYLPPILGLIVALITIMLTSMSIVKEREIGTIDQIIVSPIKSIDFIAGKSLPFAIIAFFDISIITLIAIFWFNVPFNGSFLFLLFCSLAYIISTIAVGIYISTISKTQQQAMLSTFLFFIPSIMLSGFVFPIYAMPLSIQYVTLLNPMRYFIEIVRDIFLKGVGFSMLWKQILSLVLIGFILLYFSVRRFGRRFE